MVRVRATAWKSDSCRSTAVNADAIIADIERR
jgi:hypothetical protein